MFRQMTGLGEDTSLFMIVATSNYCPNELNEFPGQ
jgi:hypothetical protein